MTIAFSENSLTLVAKTKVTNSEILKMDISEAFGHSSELIKDQFTPETLETVIPAPFPIINLPIIYKVKDREDLVLRSYPKKIVQSQDSI